MDGAARSRDALAVAPAALQELVSLLGLAAAQIEVALRESEGPVATLAEIVTSLGPTTAGQEAATALQFHDRLTQRLTHVRDTLAALSEFVDLRGQAGSASAADWDALRNDIRGRYSMEQERVMFDLLVRGATPDEVLGALAEIRTGGAASHVDLF